MPPAPKKERPLPEEFQPANTAIFDLETTNLNANYGIILCAAVKPLRLPAKVFRLDRIKGKSIRDEDKELVRSIIAELNKYDILVSYNGIRFDNRFLLTRALYHQIDPPSEKFHFDMLQVARAKLRTNNRRLDTVVNFLDLEERKTAIDPKFWRWAMMGDTEAMDYVVKHCIQDVKTLELVYEKLKKFSKSVRKV